MPSCSIAIRATDSPSGSRKKGFLSVVRDLPWTWGAKEGLPGWIHVIISDAPASEVDFFMQTWYLRYEVTTVQDIDARVRLRFVVHPDVISVSGNGRDEIKAEMSAWVLDFYGGSIVNNSVSHILADFPKPLTRTEGASSEPATIASITSDFADKFDVFFQLGRYYVAESDVDTIINAPNNGEITLTKAEALATVNDKFLD